MLTIRQDQMDVFRESGKRSFEVRMVKHIETHFPEEREALVQTGGEGAVYQLIRDMIARGETYKIVTERGVAGLIDLSVAYGQDFELYPEREWAREILEDESLEESTRVQLVLEQMPEEPVERDVFLQ